MVYDWLFMCVIRGRQTSALMTCSAGESSMKVCVTNDETYDTITRNAIERLRLSKSVGPDGLPSSIMTDPVSVLRFIFNLSTPQISHLTGDSKHRYFLKWGRRSKSFLFGYRPIRKQWKSWCLCLITHHTTEACGGHGCNAPLFLPSWPSSEVFEFVIQFSNF
jgi:hypothetical protein